MLTDTAGQVSSTVPRDRAGHVQTGHRPSCGNGLWDVDAVAISLIAKGQTTGEVSAHFHESHGASIWQGHTTGRITDQVPEEMATWASRPF